MDAAKSIALIAVNDGDYWDYIPSGTGKGKSVSNRPLPIVAITTTAGTGSEADAGTVITNEKTHEKTGFVHPDLFPALSIVDPELMLTVPPLFTAFQGFDALFHSVEGYVSNGTNLMSDMYALEAIKHISRYLPRAVADGSDLKAPYPCGLRQYPVRLRDVRGPLHQRAFPGACLGPPTIRSCPTGPASS